MSTHMENLYDVLVTDTKWLDDREARAWRAFMAMQNQLRRRIAFHLQQDSGVSETDYEILVHLSEAENGRMRAVELGAATQWEKSRLFHQISRMSDRGLVTKESCGNTRKAHVALTEKGRQMIEAAAPCHVGHVRTWFVDALTPDQLDSLADISTAILDGLASDTACAGLAACAGDDPDDDCDG